MPNHSYVALWRFGTGENRCAQRREPLLAVERVYDLLKVRWFIVLAHDGKFEVPEADLRRFEPGE